MSFISNVTAYSYTDKISAITVATSPYNNTGQYYNVLYIGTSNGKLYSFTDSSSVIYPIFQIVPSTGVLTGEITGLAIDPMGKYLFVNAPYDNHCFRFSVASIPLAPATPNQTYTIPVDRDIYTYGDNTGGITVDSQGVVYIVTGRGSSISTIERYGNSFINLLFKNEGPSLNFRGITLSPNEQVIYSVDSQFGSIYYYNFLNYQPTFDILNSSGVTSSMQNITSLRNNIYYTQTDGIYVKNTYVGSVSHIIGTDSSNNITTTDPLKITISGTNTVAVDSGGSVYLSSTSYNGNSILYKTTFYLSPRSNYQAPVPRQQQPILQPYPTTSCKRIVEPFNARTRFGWGLTNTRNRPILDVVKYPLCCPPPIVNCPVTPFYCPPTPVIPTPPLLIQPVYPLTVTTRQYTDIAHATGYRPSIIVPATTLLSTSLTFTAGYSSTQPALGALGEIYSLEDSGRLTKIYKQKVVSSKTFGTQTSGASPVISMKGAVTVATNNGILYRLNSDMATLQGYPINLGKQVFGTPANITNNAFDYIVAAYGNSLTAFNADNATAVWTSTTQTPGESFRTSVTTDGINVFVGSDNKKIYCYTAETGTLNWTCSLSHSTQTLSYPYTPYATLGYIGVTYKDDSNIFIVSNTTVRVTANDFTVRLPGGLKVSSPPVLSTDPAGNLWAHVLTMSGNIQKLYGIGGIFNAARVDFPYKYIWSNASGEEIPSSYTIPVLDSSGYIYAPSTHGVLNQYYAYLATASAGQEVTQSYVSQLVLNGTITAPNPPIQVSRTPLITSQNTMYVIATNDGTTTNYLYTISS
uniref:Pyrrolo-quinoline quinone repeat domain-containing protein n=1 Tax=viral metagenome TaxID=1070528 RepID=A0A6C0AIS5_9ZZZZ